MLHTYQVLMGLDFIPYMSDTHSALQTALFDEIKQDLLEILLESLPSYNSLLFLMPTYKQHEHTYWWLTNTFHTVYKHCTTAHGHYSSCRWLFQIKKDVEYCSFLGANILLY